MTDVKVIRQYIKDLTFQIPAAPQVFAEVHGKPNVNIALDIDARKISGDSYEVTLKTIVEAEVEGGVKLFTCNLVYSGIFTIGGEVDARVIEQLVLIYCPSLLFPFVRRIIANLTTDAGFTQIMVDPIDFTEIYLRKKKVEEAVPVSDVKN